MPGGFGERGAEGKIYAARFARERKVPYFGICFGMQMAVHRGGAQPGRHREAPAPPSSARRTEPVVGLMTEWMKGNELEQRAAEGDLGGTMRLGAYPGAPRRTASRIADIYGATEISERHRHRYEVNIELPRGAGGRRACCFAGMSPDGLLPETVELADHPWFIGVQYHPELKSRPVRAAPAVRQLHRRGGRAEPAGVSDVGRAAGEARAVDHLVLPFPNLRDARDFFARLGFTVAPDAVHPFGTGNACVFFADGTYLEPLAVVDAESYRSARRHGNLFVERHAEAIGAVPAPGISAAALKSRDALADRQRLTRAGVGELRLVEFERSFRGEDGPARTLSFRLAFACQPGDAQATFFFCEPRHGAAPNRERLAAHPNGARGISRLVLVASDPAPVSHWLADVVDGRARQVSDEEFSIDGPVGIEILTAGACAVRYAATIDAGAAGLLMAGVVLAVAELAVPRALFESRTIPFGVAGERITVGLPSEQGFIAFEENPT